MFAQVIVGLDDVRPAIGNGRPERAVSAQQAPRQRV
jgi:hypothetical protein